MGGKKCLIREIAMMTKITLAMIRCLLGHDLQRSGTKVLEDPGTKGTCSDKISLLGNILRTEDDLPHTRK